MSPRLIASVIAITIAAGVIFAVQREPLAQRMGTTPVVVELFTSQGCSSCPPADAIVESIVKDDSLRGRVIPLAFHVDYWDRLGWRDPFSSRAATQRQMQYVHAFNLNSAYTPQAVVGGRKQFTGSNGGALDAAIVELSQSKPVGTIAVDAKRDGNAIIANVRAVALPDTDVMLALVEYGNATTVKSGENGGRTLTNEAVVRVLQRLASGAAQKSVTLKIDPSWKDIAVVAFLQNQNTMAITNAAATAHL